MSIVFAARQPARVTKLILGGGYAQGRLARGETSQAEFDLGIAQLAANWGKVGGEHPLARYGPGGEDPEGQVRFARFCRMCATPSTIVALHGMNSAIDVSAVLPSIHQPTLVLRKITA